MKKFLILSAAIGMVAFGAAGAQAANMPASATAASAAAVQGTPIDLLGRTAETTRGVAHHGHGHAHHGHHGHHHARHHHHRHHRHNTYWNNWYSNTWNFGWGANYVVPGNYCGGSIVVPYPTYRVVMPAFGIFWR